MQGPGVPSLPPKLNKLPFCRWASIYTDDRILFEIRDDLIKVDKPSYISAQLSAPFEASPIGLERVDSSALRKLSFTPERKRIVRVHRIKHPEEQVERAEISDLILQLSSFGPDVGNYISAAKKWQSRYAPERRSSHASKETTQATDLESPHLQGLMYDGLALCRRIKAWKEGIRPICPPLTSLEDPTDFYQCRKANQMSCMHVGLAQMMNGVLRFWITEYGQGMDDDLRSSSPLWQLRKEAFQAAEAVAEMTEATRALIASNRIMYFGGWAAFTFFNAAMTLTVPLVGSVNVRREARAATSGAKRSSLQDRYFHEARLIEPNDFSDNADTTLAGVPFPNTVRDASSPLSGSEGLGVPLYDQEQVKRWASDVLRILELLSFLRASPLGKEARQRLSTLVETYNIKEYSHSSQVADVTYLPDHLALSDSSRMDTLSSNATASQASPATMEWQDPQGFVMLDALLQKDNEWWDQFLTS